MRVNLTNTSLLTLPLSLASARYCAAMLFLAIGVSLISAPVLADPPARVGRIGLVEGNVSFYTDKDSGWQNARLNYPVTSKNSIWTNPASRAEIRIGSSALRLDADSIVDFTNVDDSRTQLFVQRGTLNVRLRSYPANSNAVETYKDTFRVETNEGTVILEANGRYRIDAAQDRNETVVAVFAGSARFDNGTAALNIEAGKTLMVRISSGSPSFVFGLANESSFDRWAEARDVRWDDIHQRYASERNISPRMTGYEDLDEYGDWTNDREYGRLWTPRIVVANWAPYRYGSWSYVRPWGWTWVDNAAWGFAPFHYGRWVNRHARWYWAPGAYHYRPVYAPALVGWAGRGNWNISLSIGGGNVGWFPLAPREHYVPHYTSNVTYIRNINNITNNVTVINPPTNYANLVPGGTVVNNGVMVNGEPVWRTANINNQQSRSMTKPAVDPYNQSIQSMQVNALPPPTPTMSTTVRTKPAMLNTPASIPVQQVGGEPVRPTLAEAPTFNNQPMIVNGEAPRPQNQVLPQASQNKPAAVPQNNAAVINDVPQFARPIKPNPRVAVNADASVKTPTSPTPSFDIATPKKPATLVSEVPAVPSTPSASNAQSKPNQWRVQEDRRAEARALRRAEPRIEARVEGERVNQRQVAPQLERKPSEARQRNQDESQRTNDAPQVSSVSAKLSVDKIQNNSKIGRSQHDGNAR
jgi:hypothetical protein